MKKLWFIPLIFFGVMLSGCMSGGVSAEDAGDILIDRIIYQKQNQKFSNEFRDGTEEGKKIDEAVAVFEKNLIGGIERTGADIPEEDGDRLIKELLQQTKEKTSYKIVQIDETRNAATITYYVTGLDLVSAMQGMTRDLIKESLADENEKKSEQEIFQNTLEILENQLKTIKIKPDPVELKVFLKKSKGKWYIPESQEENLSNLFLAFVAGTQNNDTMNEELEEALNDVAKEILESAENSPVTTGS